jgi:hypothetical protein
VGKEAFLERYDRLREELGGTIELAEVREVLMGSVRVVALVTERAVRGERTLEFERVNVYSWAGSEITEIRTSRSRSVSSPHGRPPYTRSLEPPFDREGEDKRQ